MEGHILEAFVVIGATFGGRRVVRSPRAQLSLQAMVPNPYLCNPTALGGSKIRYALGF